MNTAYRQGCGNSMPDLVPFHSGQVRNFYLLVLVKYKKVNTILYFIFDNYMYDELTCCGENSVDPDQLAS